MNCKLNWALVAAILVTCTTAASAQTSRTYSISDSLSADVTSFGAVVHPPSSKGSKGGGKGSACGGCNSCGDCDSDQPWRLFPETAGGWQLTGWLAAGATANADSPATRINGPITFNDRSNFQANQFYMTFGRDVERGGHGLQWGGRVDFLFGTDYFFTRAAGLELRDDGSRHWNRRGNQYGLALPQAYGEVAFGNMSLKVGHFYTIIGNETVTAPDNFFYSHAYTMQYGEPFTHTGGLITWQLNDNLVAHAGLVNGWDKFDAVTDRAAFLGGLTFTPRSEQFELTATVIYGDEDGVTGVSDHTRTLYSIVFRYHINDSWEYVLQHDNGWNNYDGTPIDEEWYGINQYLFYSLNDCWTFGARAEWFRDDDGSRLYTVPLRNGVGGPVLPGGLTSSSFAGNYYNVSVGLNWTPTANIIVRPEMRFDWSDGTEVAPYDDYTKDSQLTAAFDAILLY